MKVKTCLKSMRLRTLPLSLSGTVAGVAIASRLGRLEFATVLFLILTTVLLQILSNLSNELGDTLHGTDNADRQGIHYSIQDGEMTVSEMERLINAVFISCCVCGIALILFSFKKIFSLGTLTFLALGAAAVWAAMHYTLGKKPYGYRGHGDIFVFIFFGLVSTLGSCYICVHSIPLNGLLPAAALGLFSVGVLNVNNIRDMKTDELTRTTMALKLGLRRARIYQTVIISMGWILLAAYTLIATDCSWQRWLYLVTIPLFALHLRGVWTREDRSLDPMLPLLVLSTFVTSALFGAGIII